MSIPVNVLAGEKGLNVSHHSLVDSCGGDNYMVKHLSAVKIVSYGKSTRYVLPINLSLTIEVKEIKKNKNKKTNKKQK